MTPLELAKRIHFKVICKGTGDSRSIGGIYCGDLLSIVMGRAKANDAWITVMGNVNSIAVAVLSDVSCIILAENMQLDRDTLSKAEEQGVCVLASENPVFETALKISGEILISSEIPAT